MPSMIDKGWMPRKAVCDCSPTLSCRLPLPGCLLTMFPEELDPQAEDTSLHGGRIRSFKHERGNWATYVYLPCESIVLIYQSVSSINENRFPYYLVFILHFSYERFLFFFRLKGRWFGTRVRG